MKSLDIKFPVSGRAILSDQQRSQIRLLLKPGDLLLESDKRFPLRQIAFGLAFGSRWTHSAIYAGDGIVIDVGKHPKVARRSLDDFLDTTDIAVYRPDYASLEDVSQAITFAVGNVGKPFNINFNYADEKSFYCAQLISRSLKSMSHPILLPLRSVLGRKIVSPESIVISADTACVWSTSPTIWRSMAVHWLVLSAALTGAAAGFLLNSLPMSLLCALLSASMVIVVGRVLHHSRQAKEHHV